LDLTASEHEECEKEGCKNIPEGHEYNKAEQFQQPPGALVVRASQQPMIGRAHPWQHRENPGAGVERAT